MAHDSFVIGVDFGTDSVRSVIVDARNGTVVSSEVFNYPRWNEGLFCSPSENRFRQHPLDYVEGIEHTVKNCIKSAGSSAAKAVKGISIDTTGSTPVAVNARGTPLALLPGFENDPDAMFVLWKDHTAVEEAREINEHAKKFSINYLRYVGGIYSSEWYWAKLLRVLRTNTSVRKACYTWVEHCDWIPFLLTGGEHASNIKRSICAAGHKALWASEFGGLPPNDFFATLDPLLDGYSLGKFDQVMTAAESVGRLSGQWSERLGLPPGTVVGAGAFDAHMGAVGGQIEPYFLSKVMGTSTCDMMVAPLEDFGSVPVRGICGQVPGSIIPGMMGMEAGQSAFGDAYAWFKNLLSFPIRDLFMHLPLQDGADFKRLFDDIVEKIVPNLTEKASCLPPNPDAEIALDWFNGRRTPDANQALTGAIAGIGLGSDAPSIFRAIAEGTCFGARAIVDRFIEEGVLVRGLIGLGGVARKSPYIMQMMADVMDMPIRIHSSEQTCAFGAGMFAATAAGLYEKVEDAMVVMGSGFDKEYQPRKESVGYYAARYQKYQNLGRFVEKAAIN
ncbi:MAG TPA: ribulokinase [Puia sp.]|nr:ribulokinase [Puia sp.]